MINAPDASSTRPYLIRAMYEWCTDNGFTPYIAVSVDDSVQVPREYVKDGEIVLNIGFDATSSLKLGNDFVEFKARFAGTAREIMVPIHQVSAIYARENGQGMAFPVSSPKVLKANTVFTPNLVAVADGAAMPEVTALSLARVESERQKEDSGDEPEPPRPTTPGARPALKRVK